MDKAAQQERVQLPTWLKIWLGGVFGALLVGLVLIFISHAVLNSFTYQIVLDRGGDSQSMGTAMALASLIELPVMFLFGWMMQKVRSVS